jgi:predicted short-subunit dehydrogenase-like oxidoreductase (DUF2520 family)
MRSAIRRAQLVVIASRDGEIANVAKRLVTIDPRGAVVHCAGALGPDVLRALADGGVAVAAAHPLLSFASATKPPCLHGGALVVEGDRAAVSAAKELAKRVGMRFVEARGLDRARYHAAAALAANGAAALGALAEQLFGELGLPDPSGLLGPLLGSVARNVEALGADAALTGPVRRGDVATIERHLEALPPSIRSLYSALVAAQLPLAARLGDASPAALERIELLLAGG